MSSDSDVSEYKPSLPASPTPTPSKTARTPSSSQKRPRSPSPSDDDDDHKPTVSKKSKPTKTKNPSDGSAWTPLQQYWLVEELVKAGKHAGVWERIHKEVNALQTDGKEKTKNRVSSAFTETHLQKHHTSNLPLLTSPPESCPPMKYPDFKPKNAGGWSEAQIKCLWRGVLEEGARRVNWEAVAGVINQVGPERTGSACQKTWRDTISLRFGIGKKRVRGATRE